MWRLHCLLMSVTLISEFSHRVDSAGSPDTPGAVIERSLQGISGDSYVGEISTEDPRQNTGEETTSQTVPLHSLARLQKGTQKKTTEGGPTEGGQSGCRTHSGKATDIKSARQLLSVFQTTNGKNCSHSEDGTTDHTPQESSPLPLALFAENIANSMDSAEPPRSIGGDDAYGADRDPITGDGCLTEVVERLVREASCVGEEWSCAGQCGRFRVLPCSCHHLCQIYKTCCYDYNEQCLKEESSNKRNSSDTRNRTDGENIFTGNAEQPQPELSTLPSSADVNTTKSSDIYIEQLETPAGECVHAVGAQLITSCPRHSSLQLEEACKAASVSHLSDLLPVTDPLTGLHFRNEHCAFCWIQHWKRLDCKDCQLPASAPVWVREAIHRNDTDVQLLHWSARLFVTSSNSPRDFTKTSNYLGFLQDYPESVWWEPPSMYPGYICIRKTSPNAVCSLCPGSSKSSVCQNYFSFVEGESSRQPRTDIIYNNVQCFYCHLIKTEMAEKSGENGTALTFSDLKRLVSTTTCRVPNAGNILRTFVSHGVSFPLLLTWSSGNGLSVINEDATGLQGDNSPVLEQVAWRELKCKDVNCDTESCAPYSVMQNGDCTTDLIPFTSVVIVCLIAALNSTHCSPGLQPSTTSYTPATFSPHSDPVTFKLANAILDVLFEEAPWYFETGKEACEIATQRSERRITFVFWSETSRKAGEWFPTSEAAVVSKVVGHIRRLKPRGWATWVRVCFYQVPHRAAMHSFHECSPNSALYYISPPSGNSSAIRQMHCSLCLLTVLGLFLRTC